MGKDIEKQLLYNYVVNYDISVETFINLSIAITKELIKYHDKNIIYKNISLKNIYIEKIGNSEYFDVSFKNKDEAENSDDIVYYVSPEQTGRVNFKTDFRSDLYSLGCLFYKILTGKNLFFDKEISKVIYNHISRSPEIEIECKQNIPQNVSKILLKLLNKNPGERYLSAYSLLKDLNRSLHILKDEVDDSDGFEYDKEYGSCEFKISNKVFGRTNEIYQICNCMKKSSGDKVKIVFVSGDSGIGKSSIVEEAGNLIKNKNSYFVKGKFNNDINKPYGPFNQAFTQFVKESLLENDEDLNKIKYAIEENLGNDCDALVLIVPILNLILQREVSESNKIIDEKTCHLIIHKAIEAILSINISITFFMDDFQWADDASIKLLNYLIKSIKSENIMFVIAYRSNELNINSKEAIERIKIDNSVEQIIVEPLKKISIEKIISESFKLNGEDTETLASVIYDKTGGSPFFITQFIKLIYNKQYLYFNMKDSRWTYNINKIINIDCTDNVASYVLENIQKLQKQTIKLMTIAACIGNEFELKLLSEISNKSVADTYMGLNPAVNDNLLTIDAGYYNVVEFSDICKGNIVYRFAHDRIRKTIFDINSNEDKMKNHIMIGEHLVQNSLYILEGAEHINIGVQFMEKNKKSIKFAEINYEAGKIALSKAAYADAYEFFKKAKEFLDGGDWQEEHALMFKINFELLRMEYIRKEIKKADDLAEELFDHCKGIEEKRLVYELKIKYSIALNEIAKAEKFTEEFLKMANIDFNFNPTNEEFEIERRAFMKKTANLTCQDLYSLDKINNEVIKSVLDVLSELQWIEASSKPLAFELILYKAIELSIEYGNSVASCITYCQYGYLITSKYKLADKGYEFGELAYKLVEQFDDSYYAARIAFIFGSFISCFRNPFINCIDYISKSKKVFEDKGNTTNFGYAVIFEGLMKNVVSDDLKRQNSYLRENLKLFVEMNFGSGVLIFVELVHNTEMLMNVKDESTEQAWRDNTARLENEKNIIMKKCYYASRVKSQYMLKEFEQGIKTCRIANENTQVAQSIFLHTELNLYYCLCLSQMYFDGENKEGYLNEFYEAKAEFEKVANLALINYQHKILFVQAQCFSMEGKIIEAVKTYDTALKIAEENDYIEDMAVINEAVSDFYFRNDNMKIGMFYLKEALFYYQKFGAVFKVKDINQKLEKIYSKYPAIKQKYRTIGNTINTNIFYEINNLDLKAVIDSYTAISIEIELSELLKKLVKILVKNTGAQEGYLLLKNNENYLIEAEYNSKKLQQVKILNSENYIGSSKLPESVVNYVLKAKENVILNNAGSNNIFVNDPYIVSKRPISVLCVPIIYKNKLTGAIYLQNNITASVFDENKVKLVTLIGTQAAISIENALMYKKIKEINWGLKEDIKSSSRLLNEAIEHDKLKNEFFANLSHEFRTPLNLILSAQQMLDLIIGNHTVDENKMKIENYNNIMKQNCLRLLRMINNLIDITKIDAGFFKIGLVNRDIIKIVEDVVLSVVPYVEEQGLKITFDTNVEEKIIACDGDAIERIMLNLISNAVKFSKNNSEIFVDVIDNGNNIIIKVRDTGIGIPKDKESIIFDRFMQVDKSLSRIREGSGIGLALTKSLVELLGGEISVESSYGEYSEFTIDLPCKLAIVNSKSNEKDEDQNSVIEKINIEFSDIYS